MGRFGRLLYTLAFCVSGIGTAGFGQSFGVELHNTLMPASGGMAPDYALRGTNS
jgi:hypothetical protein